MGMDVFGRQPTAEVGEYFRRNVWGWRRLPDLIESLHPEFMGRLIGPRQEDGTIYTTDREDVSLFWGSNDGFGLSADDSAALAQLLMLDVSSGAVEAWIHEMHVALLDMPREVCTICDGTGIRTDLIGQDAGWPSRKVTGPDGNPRMGQIGSCNACSGWGSREPRAASYDLEVDDVTEFAGFLAASGGFEIW